MGHDEIWGAIDGTSLAFVGTQPPGTAYMLRPDGATTHANINAGDSRVTFLYFSCNTDDPRVAHYLSRALHTLDRFHIVAKMNKEPNDC
jgi:hypothetical protein